MQHLRRDWATPGRQLCNLAMWLGANAEAKNRQKRKKKYILMLGQIKR